MKCPVDSNELVMSDRQGIEIDYCPKCRGVWLDRGELDKIIERSAPQDGPRQQHSADRDHDRRDNERRGYVQGDRDRDDDERRGYGDDSRRPPYRKRKSFLDDIFDF